MFSEVPHDYIGMRVAAWFEAAQECGLPEEMLLSFFSWISKADPEQTHSHPILQHIKEWEGEYDSLGSKFLQWLTLNAVCGLSQRFKDEMEQADKTGICVVNEEGVRPIDEREVNMALTFCDKMIADVLNIPRIGGPD